MSNNQWTIILHLSGFLGLMFPLVGNWAAPLVIWLLKKEGNPEMDRVGKEVLNFQISYTLYSLALGVIIAILMWILVGVLLLPVMFVLWVLWIIFMILAAVKASNGEFYTYPMTIQFLK